MFWSIYQRTDLINVKNQVKTYYTTFFGLNSQKKFNQQFFSTLKLKKHYFMKLAF